MPVRAKQSKRVAIDKEDARPARLIRLVAVGFPVREMHRNYFVNIENEELFELYAREQWLGSIVSMGDYIFDQRVIPDYAYKIASVVPSGSVKVTEDTIFKVEKNDLRNDLHPSDNGVRLRDVIGHSKVKQKCRIVLRYLEDPERFGEWSPKNVLFCGVPGTGKTMTARALANEAHAKFFMVRATDLVGEFVGDGSKRIHDLYSKASNCVPSVIFIDEMDAIALDRSYQSVRGDVSEVVNALLSELDGIRENIGVVTIGASNSTMLLDQAIRSRFEEELEFRPPTEEERHRILVHYKKTLPIAVSANLKKFASKTQGFSGRDLKEKLLKSALYKALLEGSDEITEIHLEESLKEIQTDGRPPSEMFR